MERVEESQLSFPEGLRLYICSKREYFPSIFRFIEGDPIEWLASIIYQTSAALGITTVIWDQGLVGAVEYPLTLDNILNLLGEGEYFNPDWISYLDGLE